MSGYRTKDFTKDFLIELIETGSGIVMDYTADATRWGTIRTIVFTHENRFYEFSYEQTQETGINDIGDPVHCNVVRPIVKTVVEFVRIREAAQSETK